MWWETVGACPLSRGSALGGANVFSVRRCSNKLKVHFRFRAERKRAEYFPHGQLMNLDKSLSFLASALACLGIAACATRDASRSPDSAAADAAGTIIVFNAGSLARPLRAARDSFTAGTEIKVEQENAGSRRDRAQAHRAASHPRLVGSADYQVFPHIPRCPGNELVRALRPQSHGAHVHAQVEVRVEIDSLNWYKVLERKGVQTGRSDPALDPNGYRSLIVMRSPSSYYKQPGLATRSSPLIGARGPPEGSGPDGTPAGGRDRLRVVVRVRRRRRRSSPTSRCRARST